MSTELVAIGKIEIRHGDKNADEIRMELVKYLHQFIDSASIESMALHDLAISINGEMILYLVDKTGGKGLRGLDEDWQKDHKISRAIVNDAAANGVKTIKLEELSGIRQSARTSRKNNHSLHNWSFYRLAKFIEYKAALAGIEVVYVNPAYTSQTCPCCGKRNHANDRNYVCSCGYHTHRDRLGAVNILTA